jgi:hypothetical protein
VANERDHLEYHLTGLVKLVPKFHHRVLRRLDHVGDGSLMKRSPVMLHTKKLSTLDSAVVDLLLYMSRKGAVLFKKSRGHAWKRVLDELVVVHILD